MHIVEVAQLVQQDISAHKTRNLMAIIIASLTFGICLAIGMILRGLENVTLKYAGASTDGRIYLISEAQNLSLIKDRIEKYHGEVVDSPATIPGANLSDLELTDHQILATFANIKDAFAYFSKNDSAILHYNPGHYLIQEVGGDQVTTYAQFKRFKDDLRPFYITFIVASVFVASLTLAHTLSQNSTTFALYRSLGASRWQILALTSYYLLMSCFKILLLAIFISLLLSALASIVFSSHLSGALTSTYPASAHFAPILIGVNLPYILTSLSVFLCAPLSTLLSIDQLSINKLNLKLKGK